MYIAKSKRKENIAEYILYLWQLEDLLRALQMSPEAVYSQLVEPREVDVQSKQELLMWYMELANLLREEGKEQHGHLEHTLHLISDLQDLHLQLLKLPVGAHYRELFARLAPELARLREIEGKVEMSDMELCFRALYAVMLYRIKGAEQAKTSIEDVLEVVSPVVAELARVFGGVESGEVDLFKQE